VQLRDHPLISYRGFSTWPPRWMPRDDVYSPRLKAEIGILTEAVFYHSKPEQSPQIFLFMEHHGCRYLAALFFSDAAFCRQVGRLLQDYRGKTIEEIGGIDVSDLL
jgi:hypothetical protein